MKPDLTVNYMGLSLANPIVASSSPLTGNVESLVALQNSGVAAVVLPSLFEEQVEHVEIELANLYDYQSESHVESSGYFAEMDSYNTGPTRYLELIRTAKHTLTIPVIASLNGSTRSGWIRYAQSIEQAGADAIELNIYSIPCELDINAVDLETEYCKLVEDLRSRIGIPLAVKIGSCFTSIPSFAESLVDSGADALVLFNRYLAPDIDFETLSFRPALELSHPSELRQTLRWIAILCDQISASIAATGGVHSAEDAVKALLVGADVTMMASALLQKGPTLIREVLMNMERWLSDHEYSSVHQLQGSMSWNRCSNPDDLLRANYLRSLTSYTPIKRND
ncbi:MAG: dihydroorotate dehydrogenase-like protein [Pirellula sp.]|jgi:dihydroorotate dehydrogenase (fumarate)|nr:dihydroorotate dehydrogenase-like protein [Pirellula sp.]